MLNNIERERAGHGFTKTEIASKLNITYTTYQSYVSGKRHIPSDILIKMADMFHCSTDYLLGRVANRMFGEDGVSHD